MEQFRVYWRILMGGWWIIVATAVLAAVGAAIITASADQIYESSARYIVSPNPIMFEDSDLERRSLDTLDNSGILITYAEVFGSNRMRQAGRDDLGLTAADMEGYNVTAVNLPQTKIIELTVRGTSPQQAHDLTEAIGSASTDYLENLFEIYQVSQLDSASVPNNPINVSPIRNAGIAGILGFVAGVALAFLYAYMLNDDILADLQAESVNG